MPNCVLYAAPIGWGGGGGGRGGDGMQLQLSSSQIPECACIFRCSVAKAAAPAVCPASETMSGFSGDDTDRSNAAGLPLKPHMLTRMSAGLDCFWS